MLEKATMVPTRDLEDNLQEDIDRFREIVKRVLEQKAEAIHRNAWQIILESISEEEKRELSEIVEEFAKQGLVVTPEPNIAIKIVRLPKMTVH